MTHRMDTRLAKEIEHHDFGHKELTFAKPEDDECFDSIHCTSYPIATITVGKALDSVTVRIYYVPPVQTVTWYALQNAIVWNM